MNFSCNKCQRRYSIADEKVRGKTVKVRCKNCQNVISVEGPPLETEESTRVVSLADVERLREQERSLAAEEEAAVPLAASAAPAAEQTPWDDEPTRTMPVRDSSSPWFVMVKSKQEGPLEEDGLRELVASGAITSRSYFWQQGMADWKRGSDIPELAGIFAPAAAPAAPPPPPARAAPPPVMRQPEPEPEPEPEADSEATAVSAPSSTSWQPEPPAPSQTTWQPQVASSRATQASTPWEQEPEQESYAAESGNTAGANGGAPLGELFSDLDLPQSEQQEGGSLVEGENPLAALGEEPATQRKPVENTHYFVKKAGVDRRNPAWKIALFLFLLIALPVGVLYALTELQVVPLRVPRKDAQGHVVEQPVSVFSAEGMGELKDLMLGHKRPPPAPEPAPAPPAPKQEVKAQEPAKPAEPKPESATQPQGEAQKDVAALYAEGEKKDTGPEVRENTEVAATDSTAQSGPPQEAISKVVGQSQSAFQSCIEQALRKNPRLKDGKLVLTATVGSSGTVKKVAFDRKELESSPMGDCLKGRARRMVFPAFSGEDVDVEIPLVVTKTL